MRYMEFDEQKAIDHIRTFLSETSNIRYDDDEILNVIDIIWDYYEENGMLEISEETEDENMEIEDLCNYVKNVIRKDKYSKIIESDLMIIVKGELDYESSLDIVF